MQRQSNLKTVCLLLAVLIVLGPSVQHSKAALQRTNEQGSVHRDDPCDQLPQPPGNANGIEKVCPAAGSSSGVAKGDFNGDGFADLAVGVPGVNLGGESGAGAVQVVYGSATGLTTNTLGIPAPQFWSQSSSGVPGASEAGDRFGSALASGDFNADGFSDLAVGVPGDDITFQNTNYADWGGVIVIYGSRNGLTTSDATVPASRFFDLSEHFFERDGHAAPGARLGQSLAWGDFNGDGAGDLAVGAPDYTLDRGLFGGQIVETGAVWILYGTRKTATALGGLSIVSNLLMIEDDLGGHSPFVDDHSRPGDHFGAALTSGDFDADLAFDLAIGAPDKKTRFDSFLGPHDDLTQGMAFVLGGTSAGLNPTIRFSHGGDTIELPGAREGAALTAGDFNGDGKADLVIGQPNDIHPSALFNVPGSLLAPRIYVFNGTSSGITGPPVHEFTSRDINGAADAESRFAAALAAGDFDGDGRADLAIGSPLKDVPVVVNGVTQTVENAGEVDVIYGSSAGLSLSRAPQRWNQDSVIREGSVAAGDRFGSSLTAWNFGRNETPFGLLFPIRTADLAIGVPYENVNGVSDAGAVDVMYGSSASNGLTGLNAKGQTTNVVFTQFTLGVTPQAGAHFGAALY